MKSAFATAGGVFFYSQSIPISEFVPLLAYGLAGLIGGNLLIGIPRFVAFLKQSINSAGLSVAKVPFCAGTKPQ